MFHRLFLSIGLLGGVYSLHAMDQWMQIIQLGAHYCSPTENTIPKIPRTDFTSMITKPSIDQVHINLLSVPQENWVQQHTLGDEDKALVVNFASLPNETRRHIVRDYLFEGNKEAEQIFNDGSYGQSMLRYAYAIEGSKKNPFFWLTDTEKLVINTISPKLHRLCIRLNGNFTKGETANLSLHEEELITKKFSTIVGGTKAPNRDCNIVYELPLACQSPYKKIVINKSAIGATLISSVFGIAIGSLMFKEYPSCITIASGLIGSTIGVVAVGPFTHTYFTNMSYPVKKSMILSLQPSSPTAITTKEI